jgi:putative flippase GtrA
MMDVLITKARSLPQPARFLMAGGFAAGVNWLARFPLSAFLPFPVAVLGATVIGMMVGFVAYRTYVFPRSPHPVLLQARDFLMVNIVATCLVVLVAALGRSILVYFMGTVPAEATAHALGIMAGAALNYFGHSAVTFRNRG